MLITPYLTKRSPIATKRKAPASFWPVFVSQISVYLCNLYIYFLRQWALPVRLVRYSKFTG